MGLDAPYTGRALEERLGHLPVTAASASPESSISDAGARDNSAEDSGDAGVWTFEGSGRMGEGPYIVLRQHACCRGKLQSPVSAPLTPCIPLSSSDFEVEAARERQSGSKRRRASTGEEDSDGEQVGSPSPSEVWLDRGWDEWAVGWRRRPQTPSPRAGDGRPAVHTPTRHSPGVLGC